MTGVGAATPLGFEPGKIGDRLFAGQSGIARVDSFDVSQHPSQIAAQTREIPIPAELDTPDLRAACLLERNAVWCCAEALRSAGCWDQRNRLRVGMVLGLGAEWQQVWDGDFRQGGQRICSGEGDTSSLADRVRARLGLRGPLQTVSAACASGNLALMLARRWLQLGWCDVCLAGACDMPVVPMSLASFGNLRALSRRNEDPAGASRPFDRGRDGFVLGEGGTVFLLETAARARSRGAQPWAEVAGVGVQSDAFHMVIPSPDPSPAATAMRLACEDARIDPRDLNYINCHATSTPVGDVAEAKVLAMTLGEATREIPVSSTKSMTGHLLTAAAAFEALACALALQRQAVPPTINLDEPDPECPLRHVPHQAEERPLRLVASNSFGFGGSNTCLILRAA